MSVPKGKRNESRFEARHHLEKIRDNLTELIMRDFGYSSEKFQKQIDKFGSRKDVDESAREKVTEKWSMQRVNFDTWFVEKERDTVLSLLRNICTEFITGNNIYPSDNAIVAEYTERRLHMDRAIGGCYALLGELQYVIRTLPVDINKYKNMAKSIEHEIDLIKGVRQADNRFAKDDKKHEHSQK